MAFWIIQTLNGLSFSMMLFLVAAGFTLIFGLMKIINIAHGSFYLLRRCEKIGFCIRNLSAKTQIGLGQELTDHEECMSVSVMD